jgi:hypothetical protein
MILIFSYKNYEQSTDPLIDWLLSYNANFIKITIEDLISKKTPYAINVNNGDLMINGINISKETNVIWYRRYIKDIKLKNKKNLKFHDQVQYECDNEIKHLIDFLMRSLNDKKWFPNINSLRLKNKLDFVLLAESLNLSVPKSIVVNNKKDLINFYNNISNIIIKPINFIGYYQMDEYTYSSYTNGLNDEIFVNIPDFFYPTLIQEKIEAEYEIRSFFLDNQLYSTAIITNNDDRHVDIKLNYKKDSTKWIPYNLPNEYQEKLKLLMMKSGLSTGSIDTIKDKAGNYVFLEVNPVGQYIAPSTRCNFYLDKKIAKLLIENDI